MRVEGDGRSGRTDPLQGRRIHVLAGLRRRQYALIKPLRLLSAIAAIAVFIAATVADDVASRRVAHGPTLLHGPANTRSRWRTAMN